MKLLGLLQLFAIVSALEAARVSPRQAPTIVYQQFHIDSVIVARYATTRISSIVRNDADESQELSFRVQLPETAFISNFTMTVNGTTYHGVAEERAKAVQEFENRQQAGENVGLVESRGTDLFQIRINTAASSMATFVIQYEELILRQLSKYRQIINLNPGSKVENFTATVRAVEEQGITFTNASSFVGIQKVSSQEVLFSFSPSMNEQNDGSFGLARDMIVEYDVSRPPVSDRNAGLFIINDCYFAQFFSPSGASRLLVDIVFVIDVSGSMSGRKIEQTREALVTIINQLGTEDRFSMVTFESTVSNWRNDLVSVSEFRQQGIQFAESLRANGGTNFDGGVQNGAQILRSEGNVNRVQLLVVLTDGQPTAGETNPDRIVANARTTLAGTQISLNCLGFGLNLNFELLARLSLANNGIVRRIYEGFDAASQLEGFFEEISQPILRNIIIGYPPNSYESISKTTFPLLFNGSELVVAGKFSDNLCSSSQAISINVTGTGASNQLVFVSQVETNSETRVVGRKPSTERLAAYLSIQQLIDQITITTNERESAAIKQKAIEQALRYNFVTELTSLIVVEERGGNFTLGEGDGPGAPEDGVVRTSGGVLPFPSSPSGGGGGNQIFNTGFGGSVGIVLTGKAFMPLLLGSLVCLYLFIF